MPLPRLVLALRVFKPRRLLAGEADYEDVGPAVVVEVVGERDEVGGIALGVDFLGLVDRVPRLEIRPVVPERPGGEVGRAVLVEIAVCAALAVKLVRKLDLPERHRVNCANGRDAA